MQFIPDYIKRKHGVEKAEYDHELIKDILEPTFGIMIYQEQIMNVAQKMGGYTLGGADLLRRAMGKKKHEVMEAEKPKFIEGAQAQGVDEKTAISVFEKMQMFASYGFNKSHSAAYSVVAYHTMYFKANYPAEYMAAVMSHNMSDIKKVASFIEECHRLGIEVDPPNINTARGKFVAKDGRVQYGMSAIKGVGSSAIKQIVEERESKGLFKSIFDFAARIDSRVCNRRTLESLIAAGAFDELNDNRAELMMGVEDILQYGARKQEEERLSQVNMFGGDAGGAMSQEPKLKPVPKWSSIERLNNERELIGFYLSGHPLTKYEEDIKLFGSQNLSDECMNRLQHESTIRFIAIITSKRQATDKKGRPIAFLQVEDLHSSMELAVFSKQFDQFSALLEVDNVVFISGKFVKRERGDSVIVNNIERVENLREKNQDNLNLRLKLDTALLDEEILNKMETLFTTNRGSTMVKMMVHSPEANGPIRMNMRNFVVDPNPELMKGLRDVLGEESVELVMGAS